MEIKRELRCKHGFTLAELLIVVAIISVLVVVSVPIFTTQLDKAKITTNEANIRAAKGIALTDVISNDCAGAQKRSTNGNSYFYCYDVASGTLLDRYEEGTKGSNGIYNIIVVVYNKQYNIYGSKPCYKSGKTKLDDAIYNDFGFEQF
jgi:prepilin-type N-terminal cleavage/methylation domain-containing protein